MSCASTSSATTKTKVKVEDKGPHSVVDVVQFSAMDALSAVEGDRVRQTSTRTQEGLGEIVQLENWGFRDSSEFERTGSNTLKKKGVIAN